MPQVNQMRVDQERSDMMRRRRGRAATVLAGKAAGSEATIPTSSVSAKALLGQ